MVNVIEVEGKRDYNPGIADMGTDFGVDRKPDRSRFVVVDKPSLISLDRRSVLRMKVRS